MSREKLLLKEIVLVESEKQIESEKSITTKDNEIKIGTLSQYVLMGGSYLPTYPTLKELPPGTYRPDYKNGNYCLTPIQTVTDDLINFPDTKSDEVIAEINNFWKLKNKFKQYGFAHKRGFLLWGPPGSGKTSTIAMVTRNMIQDGGVVLIADSPYDLGGILPQVRAIEPNRPIVVIWEDLDAVIEKFGESEVLSILDGESQVENICFIATTNYPEKLDARIVNRPSRFDKIVKIGMPSDEARSIYLKEKIGTTNLNGFDLVVATKDFSIAHLKELVVGIYCLGFNPEEAINRLSKMKKKPKSTESESSIGLYQ